MKLGDLALPRSVRALFPAFQLSLKGVNGAKSHLCCSVDIRNDRLQLQEIFPSTLFVSFGVGFVAHDATYRDLAYRLAHKCDVAASKMDPLLATRDYWGLARVFHKKCGLKHPGGQA